MFYYGKTEKWKVGEACQRLKLGIFYLKNQNPNHLFEGIEVMKVPKETVRINKLNAKEEVAIFGGFDIRRNGVVIATISFIQESIYDTNRTRPFVQMVVWPDYSFEQENY
ncbi:hypothetical protein GCK72_009166 [Caenorhabditis remanei]|uniref:Uncharacterized protein n=1 Tax=Caenorhabditis remanei TaxID=31234 RepID=A0A6A5H302_CAERE|nr:hypothetical protein GCK72_009166 [Caenorhabditis remanei]KAF1760913.1 hypothetical protein GCK72_009166 [Caenorhabditis remanei]